MGGVGTRPNSMCWNIKQDLFLTRSRKVAKTGMKPDLFHVLTKEMGELTE